MTKISILPRYLPINFFCFLFIFFGLQIVMFSIPLETSFPNVRLTVVQEAMRLMVLLPTLSWVTCSICPVLLLCQNLAGFCPGRECRFLVKNLAFWSVFSRFTEIHYTVSLIIFNVFQNAAVATTSASVPSRKSWIPAALGGSGKHGATIDIPLEVPCGIIQISCTDNLGFLVSIAWSCLKLQHVVACRIQRRRRESCCHGSRIWSDENRSEWLLILSNHFHNDL